MSNPAFEITGPATAPLAPRFAGFVIQDNDGGGDNMVMDKPAGVNRGDLLYLVYLVADVAAEAATLDVPAGWTYDGFTSAFSAVRALNAFHYVDDPADEPATYTFTYSAARPTIAALVIVRGIVRDYQFDSGTWPLGYYAPGESSGGASSGTGTALAANAGGYPQTAVANALVHYALFAYNASGTGFPDVAAISSALSVYSNDAIHKVVLAAGTKLVAAPATPVADVTATTSASRPWRVESTTFEPGVVPLAPGEFVDLVISATSLDLTSGTLTANIGGVTVDVWHLTGPDAGLSADFLAGGSTLEVTTYVPESGPTVHIYTFHISPSNGWGGACWLFADVIRGDDADALQQWAFMGPIPAPAPIGDQPGGIGMELD